MLWDYYKEACAVQERKQFPIVGLSTERRTMEHVAHIYNDERIHSFVCFACAQIKVDTGGCRSDIRYYSGEYLFKLPRRTLQHTFSYSIYRDKYCKAFSPLASCDNPQQTAAAPNFKDWQVTIAQTALEEFPDLATIAPDGFLCCPEDQLCLHECETKEPKQLCKYCQVPICTKCIMSLEADTIIPHGLCNDNWHGYIQEWIYKQKVTWMEKTVCSPYWTGLTVFTVGALGG